MFATIQVIITILQFVQSSLNSATNLGRWFGAVGITVVVIMMWYMYKVIKNENKQKKFK